MISNAFKTLPNFQANYHFAQGLVTISHSMIMNSTTMKTRFAPSPTGLIHIGNARTALFSALLAAGNRGTFLLRVEDTDMARSEQIYKQELQHDLHWLGLAWQEGVGVGGEHAPYYQSERMSVYQAYYQQLIDQGRAFECYKTEEELEVMRKVQRSSGQAPRYPKNWRQQSKTEIAEKKAKGIRPALRFIVPDGEFVEFEDLVKGKQRFAADDIGDFVIRKADGSPSFMFCNAVDDSLMGVTHVFRGEDHLTNTPRQLMILQALGLRKPDYGHTALILGQDGAPLSKRNGSRSIQAMREAGFLPLGVVNYLARLGHYYANTEFMSFAQLAAAFQIESLGSAAARFDEQQLIYWQKQAVAQADNQTLWQWMGGAVHTLVPEAQRDLFIETVRENVTFPHDALEWAELLFEDSWQLSDEAQAVAAQVGSEFFDIAIDAVKAKGADFAAISELLKAEGYRGKSLFQPLRVALTGQLHGPQMGGIVSLLGTQRCCRRLQTAKPQFIS
jgi:glutamyl-tRNA synthetase